MPAPYKIFTIYAREDAQYLEELRGQLRPLENAGRIKVWSDREINPGVDWEQEIVHNLDTADIILILVSAAYYNSAYIHEKEIKYALARHEQGQAKVLPIIVRPVDFSDDPVISRLQVLPTDGKPVNDRRHWQERDDAWLDVVAGIKRTLTVLTDAEKHREQQAQAAILAAQQQEDSRRQAEKAAAEKLERETLETERRKQTAASSRTVSPPKSVSTPRNKTQPVSNDLPPVLPGNKAPMKAKPRKDLPVRYAFMIGSGVIALLFLWLVVDYFTDKKEPQGVHTLSPASLPPNVGVQVKKSGLVMVPVEGGTFMMGSPANEKGRHDDECQHSVTVQSFKMGKFEVTQADWRNIMGIEPSELRDCEDCPVDQVSWDDVQEFLKKLNAKFPSPDYRLPSEAEWEYAARGGKKNTGYHTYSGAGELSTVAWYTGNSESKTHPVGDKSPNELGLCDMSGNVSEWCQNIYQPYSCDKKTKASHRYRVMRGGCFIFDSPQCRAASRDYEPSYRDSGFGFRLVSFQ